MAQDNWKRATMSKVNALTRRLVVLFLTVVAATSLAAPANAASNSSARWLTVEADGSVSTADTGSPVTPLALTSYISNETNIAVGVSRVDTAAAYTHLVAAHRRTDDPPLSWDQAASFYVGAGGYCIDVWTYQNGAWRFGITVGGPREYLIDQRVMRWAVRNFRRC
ncbi:MAG: hypothetical protein HOV94_29285 [Saccharothrix sp.]|nr:hypothetical protein [Saccharothrix sp.]